MQIHKVNTQLLDPSAWAPFGWLPVRDTDPQDGKATLAFTWGDPHLNVISHRRDEVEWTPEGPICEVMFHHWTHTQALLVLNCEAVVVVAPPNCKLREPADLGQVRAFLLAPGSSFVLHQGTWHWGPFPTTADKVDLFNVQGRRYAEDNECADLQRTGAKVGVLMGEMRSSPSRGAA